MADNLGAASKPYDYKDYYTPIRGRGVPDDTSSITNKLRALFGAIGVNQAPVDPQATGLGDKLRGGLGLAPFTQPTATQADVRKSDNAMAGPGAVPVAAPAAPASDAAPYGMTRPDASDLAAPPVAPAPAGFGAGAGYSLPGPDGRPVTIAPSVTTMRGADGQKVITNTGGKAVIPPMELLNNFGGYNMKTYGANFNPETMKFDTPVARPAAPAGPSAQDLIMRKIAEIEGDPAYANQSKARLGAVRELMGDLVRANSARETTGMQTSAQRDVANIGASVREAGSPKDAIEAAKLAEEYRIAMAEPNLEKRRLILARMQAPVEDKVFYPPGAQPFDKDYLVGTKGATAFRVPITQPNQVATKADFAADVKRMGSKEAALAEYARRNITPPKE